MSSKTSSRGERGFTLIELLVVMAIIALMALVAAPWFLKLAQRNQVRSAAREVQTSLLAARMAAVKRNLPARVQITKATSGMSAHLVEVFEEITPTPRLVNRAEVSKRVDFPGTVPTVIFQGDGRTAADATITVRGVSGASVTNDISIVVHQNGRVEFVEPTDWK
jgi:prepilin-type N-terminal cleavage/methylation domain-containing protein